MAATRKQGRPKKGAIMVCLSLTNPIAQRVHYELSKRGTASTRYQEALLKAYSDITPLQEQWDALNEELRLINRMEESEHEATRAKYAGLRDFINRLQDVLREKQQDKNLAEAERDIEMLKQQVKE